MNDYLRFSRDKRFFRGVTFREFHKIAKALLAVVQCSRPSAKPHVMTCEDMTTYRFSTVTFESNEATEALKNRKIYELDEFTLEVWERSLKITLVFKDDADPQPFMICLSCDQSRDATRILFYGQCLEQKMYDQIFDTFAKPNFFYKIGNGFQKLSKFNLMHAASVTGVRPF